MIGFIHLWIDGVPSGSLTGMDNDTRRVETARLGAIWGSMPAPAASSTWMPSESRRQTYIGPPRRPAPICQDIPITTAEDTAGMVYPNCTDPDGDTLSYYIVSLPQHGVVVKSNGSFTYTPAHNYFGADSFTYKANDGTSDSIPATVSITITLSMTNRWLSTIAPTPS